MEAMTFHLDAFEGPLDLLLHLISKNKVSIYDIPIAEICEQYMEVLEDARRMDMEVAGDFIAMAAQLIYIKSKMLLPVYEEEDEDDPRLQLVEMLLEYQRIKEMTPYFRQQTELGRDIYVKQPELLDRNVPVEYHHSVEDLLRAARAILEKAQQRVPPSAWITSQSTIICRSPSTSRSSTARSERPISRWISALRPFSFSLEISRGERVLVARGSIAYSAVTQPSPLPARNGGTLSSTVALHSTRVFPTSISTEPSACMV